MNVAMLRVEGPDSAIDDVLQRLPVPIDTRWREGDPKRGGGVHPLAGFTAVVADTLTSGEMLVAIEKALARCHEAGIVFPALGLAAELAVGVIAGGNGQLVAGVGFSHTDLQRFADCGIALSVSAYPPSGVTRSG